MGFHGPGVNWVSWRGPHLYGPGHSPPVNYHVHYRGGGCLATVVGFLFTMMVVVGVGFWPLIITERPDGSYPWWGILVMVVWGTVLLGALVGLALLVLSRPVEPPEVPAPPLPPDDCRTNRQRFSGETGIRG